MLSHAFYTRVEGALQLARWSERGVGGEGVEW